MHHHVSRVLPFTPEELFKLVGEVQAYPDFVPWIDGMRTWNARKVGDGVDLIDAEAGVGFSFLKERFATRVRRDAINKQIDVHLLSGPFKKLVNRWRFLDAGHGSTRVEFDIDFQFKSRILEGLLRANFGQAVEKLMTCFEARARSLYPKPGDPEAPAAPPPRPPSGSPAGSVARTPRGGAG